MELIQRFRGANTYDDGAVMIDGRWHRRRRTILGGVPNVPIDIHGNLGAFDNTLKVITSHPLAGYVVKQGPFWLGFHDKVQNKYASAMRLMTGEQMVVRLDGPNPAVTPTVKSGHTLEWDYGAAGWIRQYATERCVKEILLQKAGRTISFRYSLTGLTPSLSDDRTQAIMRRSNGQVAFSVARPYYITAQGEWDGWVPVSWTQDGNDYVVTLAAPDTDRLVDPTIDFGEGSGMTGGDHKCHYIYSGDSDRYFGAANYVQAGNFASKALITLLRYSLLGHIGTAATVNSSTLHMFLYEAPSSDITVSLHRLLTAYGITSTNQGGAADQEPAANGQGTWRRAFDYNGAGGDVDWDVAGGFSSNDYAALESSVVIGSADAVGTRYQFSADTMTAVWVMDDDDNRGACLRSPDSQFCRFDSLTSPTVAERPYLAVDYVSPAAVAGGGGFRKYW